MTLLGHQVFQLNANEGPVVVRLSIGMMILSFIATFFRFFARKIIKQPLLWDDWFIVLALAFSWVTVLWHIIAVNTGEYGRHAHFATPDSIYNFFKALYVVQITYLFAIACIKFSIMLFYRRLFQIHSTKIPLLILGAVVLAWLIATVLAGVFSCSPIDGFWRKSKPSKCIDHIKYYMAVAIPNITTDVMLLIFPMPILWRLNMNRSKKAALSCIFLIGGFIIIISCLRLVTVLEANHDKDFTWALVPLGLFNIIEMNVGILCACLPSMTPLLQLMMGRLKGSQYAKSESNKVPTNSGSNRTYWLRKRGDMSLMESNASLTWLNEAPNGNHTAKPTVSKPVIQGPPQNGDIELQAIEHPTAIHVKQSLSWSEGSTRPA